MDGHRLKDGDGDGWREGWICIDMTCTVLLTYNTFFNPVFGFIMTCMNMNLHQHIGNGAL